MSKCIIMCAGEFEPLQIEKEEDDFVIAADNGLSYLLELGILPDIVIGDYDSLSPEGQRTLRELEETQPERVDTCRWKRMIQIRWPQSVRDSQGDMTPFTSMRRSGDVWIIHWRISRRLLSSGRRERKDIFCPRTACCLFFRMKQESFRRGFAAAFGDRCRGVTIRGMKYELEDAEITNTFPIGVSNYIPGDQKASVTIREGMALAYVSWG